MVEQALPADLPWQLLGLARRARVAGSAEELAFLAVNDSHALAPYRQAALWQLGRGVTALSGVVAPEANAPYAQWLDRLCRHLHAHHRDAAVVTALQLPAELAEEWHEWLPPHGLWLPLRGAQESAAGGLFLAAPTPWRDNVIALLTEWMDVWQHAWCAQQRPAGAWSWSALKHAVTGSRGGRPPARGWKQRRTLLAAPLLAALFIPVHLSVLAPGELVPANPAVIRAPVDGVIGQFHVQPNQSVKAGQPLFSFDEAPIAAHQEVAAQALATAQAEYRQYAQQAVSDNKSKAQLAGLLGRIEEKRAEADYVTQQFARSRVGAPQDGIVLFDDPSDWIGKPVQTGERIMRIAAAGDVEVEAWLPVGDAIPLPDGAVVTLYLASSPLDALSARLRYVAHDAMPRPDGSYAYRVRARLDGAAAQRVGLKGTAKLSGQRVPLIYWMLRRPLATIRQTVGW